VNRGRPLAALLLVLAVVAALAVPAGAVAPPKSPKPSHWVTAPCTIEPGHATVIWGRPLLKVRNPCSHWLSIDWGDGSSYTALFVAPGAHAKVKRQFTAPEASSVPPDQVWVMTYGTSDWPKPNQPCYGGPGTEWLVYSSKRVVPPPSCP